MPQLVTISLLPELQHAKLLRRVKGALERWTPRHVGVVRLVAAVEIQAPALALNLPIYSVGP